MFATVHLRRRVERCTWCSPAEARRRQPRSRSQVNTKPSKPSKLDGRGRKVPARVLSQPCRNNVGWRASSQSGISTRTYVLLNKTIGSVGPTRRHHGRSGVPCASHPSRAWELGGSSHPAGTASYCKVLTVPRTPVSLCPGVRETSPVSPSTVREGLERARLPAKWWSAEL